MHKTQFDTACKPDVYGFIKREVWHIDGGWGTLIFNHKDNNIIIPNDLKHIVEILIMFIIVNILVIITLEKNFIQE
jgi:hypothetical protein